MLHELNYEPNVDDVIIQNNDGMIRCYFYIFTSHLKPSLINSHNTPYLIKYLHPQFADIKLRHTQVKFISEYHRQGFLVSVSEPCTWGVGGRRNEKIMDFKIEPGVKPASATYKLLDCEQENYSLSLSFLLCK